MTLQELLEQLETTRAHTLPLYDLPETDLAKRHAPNKWSVRQTLHHLADAETVLYERIRRVICEPKQVIWVFDQDAWAKGLDYETRPLGISKVLYNAVRSNVIHQAKQHFATHGHLEFVHSESGLRTLKDEFEKVAWHNAHHLGFMRQALG